MPHFYFYIHNGHGETADDVGSDLEDQAAARRLAIDSVRSMVAEDARRGVIDLKGRIDILDDANNLLVAVDYVEAFELSVPDPNSRTH